MPERGAIALTVNGFSLQVDAGTTVAAAVLISGLRTRTSISGEARAPLCGMGICYECRVTVNGVLHRKVCQVLCEPGMVVETS